MKELVVIWLVKSSPHVRIRQHDV